MSFREELGKMRREYRRDVAEMAKRQEELEARVDQGFERMGGRLHDLQSTFQAFQVAVQDQMSALVEDNRQTRADLKETSRTVTGRIRLAEGKLDKMLDLVEQEAERQAKVLEVIPDIVSRVEALERRDNPAA